MVALVLCSAGARGADAADDPAAAVSVEPGGVYAHDALGRRFRVGFDPGSRLFFDAQAALGDVGDPIDAAFGVGLAHRTFAEYGAGDSIVSWQVENRVLVASVRPWRTAFDGVPAFGAEVWAGSFRRHTAEPYITVPTTPPRRLPFPFDIGIDAGVGRVEASPAPHGELEALRCGVLRAAVFVDPWRSGRPGTGAELGAALRYDVDLVRRSDATGGGLAVVHRVAPLSALYTRLRWQDAAGLTFLDLRGELAPHWVSTGNWATLLEASARLERTLIAINDAPVGVFVGGRYAIQPPLPGGAGRHAWNAAAGVVLGIPLAD